MLSPDELFSALALHPPIQLKALGGWEVITYTFQRTTPPTNMDQLTIPPGSCDASFVGTGMEGQEY